MRTPVAIRPLHELRLFGHRTTQEAPAPVLKLRATSDGWALVGQDDEVVFLATGPRARQECLEFAREHGVLALSS
ncbi:MAG: hypothetical protein JO321_02635 [Solirubrobacterales bacterium]|nr:hypothetical protein [Solirubrobacterales bacterium]MBV8941793.1 hypothetical protein [Solirubrobacterales bacterium]MBV9167959.1 hypothetical protein [Solirubrobacterales bacterium]MBV9534287.1 hypothetical protein [Solirubrobacterales bacterium]